MTKLLNTKYDMPHTKHDMMNDLKIRMQVERLQTLLESFDEAILEEIRDESLLLADSIEEYVYQRNAQRIVEELLEETRGMIDSEKTAV